MRELPISWSDTFSVGHEILDNQHKKILGICAEIHQLAEAGAKDFSEVLFHMHEYAKAHFLTEEKVLEESGYPETEAHRAGHQAYYAAMAQFNFSNMNGTIKPQELAEFAQRWWMDHILHSDMKYKSHFQSRTTTTNSAAQGGITQAQPDLNQPDHKMEHSALLAMAAS